MNARASRAWADDVLVRAASSSAADDNWAFIASWICADKATDGGHAKGFLFLARPRRELVRVHYRGERLGRLKHPLDQRLHHFERSFAGQRDLELSLAWGGGVSGRKYIVNTDMFWGWWRSSCFTIAPPSEVLGFTHGDQVKGRVCILVVAVLAGQ